MKIRIEVDSAASKYPSGIGYYTQRLTNALASYPGATVLAFFFNFLKRQPSPSLVSSVFKEENVLFPLRIYAKLQSHGLALPFDLFSKKVDLTIFPNYASWPHAKTRLTATAIHDLTYLLYPELTEEGNQAHLSRVVERSIASSDFIITISEAVKKELLSHFSFGNKPIVVTPIPPDAKFFKPSNNEVHKKYSIPTKDYIFFISTVEPRKNLPLLIEAYRSLPKKLQETYSLIISGGMGWKSESSQAAIKEAQQQGLNIVYTGYIDEKDKPALYQKAALFVMPSIYEGFGMPLLEAAASKTPIVATDIPVFRESIGDGAAFFKSNDARSLTDTIHNVLTDKPFQKKLIDGATKKLSTLSWETNADIIVTAAQSLLDTRR